MLCWLSWAGKSTVIATLIQQSLTSDSPTNTVVISLQNEVKATTSHGSPRGISQQRSSGSVNILVSSISQAANLDQLGEHVHVTATIIMR